MAFMYVLNGGGVIYHRSPRRTKTRITICRTILVGIHGDILSSCFNFPYSFRYLHRFLSLPYLALRRESLRHQLEANDRDARAARQELDLYFQVPM